MKQVVSVFVGEDGADYEIVLIQSLILTQSIQILIISSIALLLES